MLSRKQLKTILLIVQEYFLSLERNLKTSSNSKLTRHSLIHDIANPRDDRRNFHDCTDGTLPAVLPVAPLRSFRYFAASSTRPMDGNRV